MRGDERAREKLTIVQPAEFGFFSGLRVIGHAPIMLARFDRTVLIGTWSLDENARASHQVISYREFDPDETAARSLDAASSSTRDKKLNGALGP